MEQTANKNLQLNLETPSNDSLSKEEFSRYTRQMMLGEIGLNGQEKIKKTSVLVIGAGGIGSSVLMYLSALGIGKIGIIDDDKVDSTNLHRQVIHTSERQGVRKTESALQFIKSLNPNVNVQLFSERITALNALSIVKPFDYVLDGCDNALTRYLVNDACVVLGKVLVSGASVKWEGQVTVYNKDNGPCYRCLYPECPKANQMMSCSANGVIGMAPGITGQILVVQLLKLIIGSDSVLVQKLLIFNLLTDFYKVLKIRGRKKDCVVCSDDNRKHFDIAKYDYNEFVGVSCSAPTKLSDSLENLTWKEFHNESYSSLKILDVRPKEQFNIVRFEDESRVLNIPLADLKRLSDDEIINKLKLTDKSSKFLVLCRRGIASVKASNHLQERGFSPVNLDKGLTGYKNFKNIDVDVL